MSTFGINHGQVQTQWKEIVSGSENRKGLLSGIQKLREVVASTMGAKGKTVILHDESTGTFITTKDGVSVAKSIHFKDPIQNIGANQIKAVADNVVKAAGDGTTTSIVVTTAICEACNFLIEEKGLEPYDIVVELDKLKEKLLSDLEKSTYFISDENDVKSIAHIACNSDSEISDLIVKAIMNFGEDTVINIEKSSTSESYVEETKGYSIDRGFLNHNFKDPNKVTVEYSNPLVFVCKDELVGTYDVEHILEIAKDENRPLVIIAKDFLQDAYNYLAMNKLHRSFPILPIKAPRHGIEQHNILEDIAIYTNATLVSKDSGFAMGMVDVEDFGTCDHVKSGSDYTHIFGGHFNGQELKERVHGLKVNLQDTLARDKHEHFVLSLKERISKLEGGIATIYVGGFTEQEIKEKYDRVEDSLLATISAIDHGYIVGGGLFYLKAAVEYGACQCEGDTLTIKKSLSNALMAPSKIILANAMLSNKPVVEQQSNQIQVDLIMKAEDVSTYNTWIDCIDGGVCDFKEAGIIDAAMSTKTIINSAISFAKTFITTHATIVHKIQYFQNLQS